jgi:hypothetical protein
METPRDSNLEQPLPDQPIEDQSAPEPHPEREHPREPGEHEAEEAQRAEEREQQVRDHNDRTGGAPVEEGGVTAQREEHQERTPDADSHGA